MKSRVWSYFFITYIIGLVIGMFLGVLNIEGSGAFLGYALIFTIILLFGFWLAVIFEESGGREK